MDIMMFNHGMEPAFSVPGYNVGNYCNENVQMQADFKLFGQRASPKA